MARATQDLVQFWGYECEASLEAGAINFLIWVYVCQCSMWNCINTAGKSLFHQPELRWIPFQNLSPGQGFFPPHPPHPPPIFPPFDNRRSIHPGGRVNRIDRVSGRFKKEGQFFFHAGNWDLPRICIENLDLRIVTVTFDVCDSRIRILKKMCGQGFQSRFFNQQRSGEVWSCFVHILIASWKTNMTMENQRHDLQMYLLLKNVAFPASHVSFQGGSHDTMGYLWKPTRCWP